jgi:hypothetical protein
MNSGGAKLIPQLSPTFQIVLRVVAVLIVAGLVALGIYFAVQSYKSRATPENIRNTASEQLNRLIQRYSGPYATTKGTLNTTASLPEDQRLLINLYVRTVRLCGYLGPFSNGVSNGAQGTRLALNSGARCIIAEIDMDQNEQPILTYKDPTGVRMALNNTTIESIAKHIHTYGFSQGENGGPSGVANDPLILVLYFVRTPSQTDKPKSYIEFLAKVAKQLQPLSKDILSLTPQGDYRRQNLESQLFFTPVSVLMGKLIIITNADTSVFRNLSVFGMNGQISEQEDLDLFIHARAYTPQSPSGLGITVQPPSNTKPAVILTTPFYWTATPPDRTVEQQNMTKQSWTIAMEPVATATNSPNEESLKKLYETYGVQSVPFVLFDEEKTVEPFLQPFMKNISWRSKVPLLRFIPPAPIPIQKAMPETNALGGKIIPPTFA